MPALLPKAFDWFGSKRRHVALLRDLVPPDRFVYCEPYAGSASLLFALPRCRVEIINDLDGDVVNFFKVLRDDGHALAEQLRLTPYAREEMLEARTPTPDLSPLERARRFAVNCNQSFLPRRGGFRVTPSKSDGVTWMHYHQQLLHLIDRLQGVIVESCEALYLIQRVDTPETVFYIDPPYHLSLRTKKKDMYRHDFSHEDHENLANLLHTIKGKCIVSSYDTDVYDTLYTRFHKTLAKPSWITAGSGQGADRLRPVTEALYFNFLPPPQLFGGKDEA